jgi:hypothetical protein
MTLFKAKQAVEDITGSLSAKWAEAGKRGLAHSPMKALAEENKALRHALRQTRMRISAFADRIDSLESRADQQEVWNADCEAEVKRDAPQLFPPTQCPECRNIYPQAVEFFPGMARSDVPDGIDYGCGSFEVS